MADDNAGKDEWDADSSPDLPNDADQGAGDDFFEGIEGFDLDKFDDNAFDGLGLDDDDDADAGGGVSDDNFPIEDLSREDDADPTPLDDVSVDYPDVPPYSGGPADQEYDDRDYEGYDDYGQRYDENDFRDEGQGGTESDESVIDHSRSGFLDKINFPAILDWIKGHRKQVILSVVVLVVVLVLLKMCGGGGEDSSDDAPVQDTQNEQPEKSGGYPKYRPVPPADSPIEELRGGVEGDADDANADRGRDDAAQNDDDVADDSPAPDVDEE